MASRVRINEILPESQAQVYERRTEEFYRAAPADFDGLEDQLRDAALLGTSFFDTQHHR